MPKNASHVRPVGQRVGAAVQAAHAELPLPQAPSWTGYWTFVTAAIIVMFILYLAQKGTLGIWLSFFSWSSPAPIGTTAGAPGAAPSALDTPLPGTKTPGTPGLTINPFAGLPGVLNPFGGK